MMWAAGKVCGSLLFPEAGQPMWKLLVEVVVLSIQVQRNSIRAPLAQAV